MTQTTEQINPQATDTTLSGLYAKIQTEVVSLNRLIDQAHHAIGDRKSGKRWLLADVEAESRLRKQAETFVLKPWSVYDLAKIVRRIDQHRAEIMTLQLKAEPHEELYAQHRWSRFFLVTSSGGGHIHASMDCQTCRMSTTYAWLPKLSSLTDKDAVEEHGPLLCSVCFPSAPVAWTVGKPVQSDHCAGVPDPEKQAYRVGDKYYRRCSCGENVIVTASGRLRKHKPGK